VLPGCTTPGPGGAACEPPLVNGIDWVPDIAHPVAWGEDHLGPADGAPRPLSIYYPSHRFIPSRPLLRHCLVRWPLVMFLHGDPPQGLSTTQRADYHRLWWRVPVALARSGYVVAVPRHTANPDPSDEALAALAADVAWLRTNWHGGSSLDVRPTSTSFIGHSWGAVLAGRAAAELPAAAFASLGGGLPGSPVANRLSTFPVPAFFMYLDNRSEGSLAENLDGIWAEIAEPRWRAVYRGRHFDYLDSGSSGSEARGDCALIGGVAADLVALFIAANVQSLTRVPIDLKKPTPPLSDAQQALAIQHLTSIDRIGQSSGCRVDLSWRVSGEDGARTLGA
jgi:hypothetical protein